MSTQVIEWAPFRLRDGVSEPELREASRQLQSEFLARQPGFLRRELVRGDDGGFVDVVWWASRRAAEEAVENAAASASCARYFSLMEQADHAAPGAGVSHFATVETH
jgi:hypothetical protein